MELNKLKMSYLSSVSVLLIFLFLLDNTTVLADYENTFSSYFEQPCCSGPHHLRHHKGKYRLKFRPLLLLPARRELINIPSYNHLQRASSSALAASLAQQATQKGKIVFICIQITESGLSISFISPLLSPRIVP
jgi:hypothetical protein